MNDYVAWSSVSKGAKSNSDNKLDYLKLKSDETYRIRPILYPVKFFKYFHKKDGRLRTAICEDPDTCPVKERHSDLKKPSLRYAAIVIDRGDDKVKILEAPQSVFRPLGNSEEVTGRNPGSAKNGSDWQIKVTGKNINTVYDSTFIDTTPLTDSEKKAVKVALGGDQKVLRRLYKIDTPEVIEEKLFGDFKKKTETSVQSSSIEDSGFDKTTTVDSEDVESVKVSDDNDDFDANWE